MKAKFILILVLIQLFSFPLIAQKKANIDSLLQVYKDLPNDTTKAIIIDDIFKFYIDQDTSKLKEYAKQQLELSKEIDFQKGIGKSWHKYAVYFYNKSELDSAKFYFTKTLKKYEDIGFIKGQAVARLDLGKVVNELDDYDTAIKVFSDNTEFYKKIKDSFHLAKTYEIEARAHFFNDNYKLALNRNIKALKYFESKNLITTSDIYKFMAFIECELQHNEKALEYAIKALTTNEVNKKGFVNSIYKTMGIIYTQQKDFKKADSVFNKAFGMAKEANWPYMQKLVLYNHSNSYKERNDYATALKKAQAYLEIENISSNKKNSSLGQLAMGTALVKLNKAKEAKVYLDNALAAAKKERVVRRQILSYQNRAEANAKLNKYMEAFEDHKKYAKLRDSVLNEAKSNQIEEMRAIFDTEKKEQQIAQQETEISLLEEKEKVSQLQKIALGGGLGLSVLLAGLGFYGFRQKIKRNSLEKEKVEAELAFKKKELTTHALHLAKKNKVLEEVKQKAKELTSGENVERGYQTLVQTITFDQKDDKAWENFTQYFEAVHKDFTKQIVARYPEISKNELRLMALLKMNMSSKEIASILNISADGVKKARQRLRRKMQLTPEDSLETTVMAF